MSKWYNVLLFSIAGGVLGWQASQMYFILYGCPQ